MYTIVCEKFMSDNEIICDDFDHAMRVADVERNDKNVRRIALMKRNRIIAVVYDARNMYELQYI